jgi:hypothetical protein
MLPWKYPLNQYILGQTKYKANEDTLFYGAGSYLHMVNRGLLMAVILLDMHRHKIHLY